MPKGGRRYTHATLAVANLDHLVMLAHAARHELTDLIDHPAHFEDRITRIVDEAGDLVGQTIHHVRLMASA